MEQQAAGSSGDGTPGSPAPSGIPVAEVVGLLDGMPRQRGPAAEAVSARPVGLVRPEGPVAPDEATPGKWARALALRLWHLLPTPTGTPFTYTFVAVLLVTAFVAEHASPDLVYALVQGSSTDVAHLLREPVFVLVASALWVAGGLASPYALVLVLVLTALERRIGGLRTAGVFALGHVLATLATEVPVGFAVLVGWLPVSSAHRLDYGISFGVAASVGALAGLLRPWLGWPMLLAFGWMLVADLAAYADPMTDWGHVTALAIGVATWPWARRYRRHIGSRPVGAGRAVPRALRGCAPEGPWHLRNRAGSVGATDGTTPATGVAPGPAAGFPPAR
ncbi:rhomboid-like protein [Streptomyces graminilatus]|uniref:rhomboid-like protein n=1 Tax=Streptomyces graminilatus TaxID=1464070 RepID=UPI000A75A152|nr:rhomboid-like protein [Streptomyces graminilatus]